MSFAGDVKIELCRAPINRKCCAQAEAYGVLMYVCMIFLSCFIGYSVGTAPVISYNYGAQNKAELQSISLNKAFKLSSRPNICKAPPIKISQV